jgi:hypothetical protein
MAELADALDLGYSVASMRGVEPKGTAVQMQEVTVHTPTLGVPPRGMEWKNQVPPEVPPKLNL